MVLGPLLVLLATALRYGGVLGLESSCDNSQVPDLCGGTVLLLGPETTYTSCGGEIQKRDVTEPPSVKFKDAKENTTYILLMRDPDAGEFSDVLHWLVADILGADLQSEKGVTGGNVLMRYEGPNPPPGQQHRYQFYLFDQTGFNLDQSKKSLVRRTKFDTMNFFGTDLCFSNAVASYQYTSSTPN